MKVKYKVKGIADIEHGAKVFSKIVTLDIPGKTDNKDYFIIEEEIDFRDHIHSMSLVIDWKVIEKTRELVKKKTNEMQIQSFVDMLYKDYSFGLDFEVAYANMKKNFKSIPITRQIKIVLDSLSLSAKASSAAYQSITDIFTGNKEDNKDKMKSLRDKQKLIDDTATGK